MCHNRFEIDVLCWCHACGQWHGLSAQLCVTALQVFLYIASTDACNNVRCTQEAYNDALYFKDEALRAFKLGILSLEERAQVRPMDQWVERQSM